MGGITRVGDRCTGHDACPPVALAGGSPTVSIEGRPVGRVGDPYEAHGCKDHPSHVGTISAGAAHVFVDGRAVGRVGDPVSCGGTVAEGSPTVTIGDGGGAEYAAETKAALSKMLVERSLRATDADVIIPYLPDIAHAIAGRVTDADNRQGWLYLEKFFRIWLNSAKNQLKTKEDRLKVSTFLYQDDFWDWAVKYNRFHTAYHKLADETLFSSKGLKVLKERLETQFSDVWENGGDFAFSAKAPRDWENCYMNRADVSSVLGITLSDPHVDGMFAAFASHSIKALVDGHVEVSINPAGTPVRLVTVSAAYAYLFDLFTFDGDQDYKYWSKDELNLSFRNTLGYVNLTNEKFREYQDKFNTGGDFVIVSLLHPIDGFLEKSFPIY